MLVLFQDREGKAGIKQNLSHLTKEKWIVKNPLDSQSSLTSIAEVFDLLKCVIQINQGTDLSWL